MPTDPLAAVRHPGHYAFSWGDIGTLDSPTGISQSRVLAFDDVNGGLFGPGVGRVRRPRPHPFNPVATTGLAFKVATTGWTSAWLANFSDFPGGGRGPILTSGDYRHGELGRGSTEFLGIQWTQTSDGESSYYSDVSAGGNIPTTFGTLFGVRQGFVRAWGYNDDGQMGLGDTTQYNAVVTVWDPNVFGASAVRVHAGGRHCLVLDDLGRVWSAGNNGHGQLGRGTIGVNSTSWGQVASAPPGTFYTDIAASHDSTLLLLNTGAVMGCGDGQYHNLGPTIFAMASSHTATPTIVDGLTDVVELMSHGRQSWFRTGLTNDLYTYGHFGEGTLDVGGIYDMDAGGVTRTHIDNAPMRVVLDYNHTTFIKNVPETIKCAKLAYTSGNSDYRITNNWTTVTGGTTVFSTPYCVIGTDGKLYIKSEGSWGETGDGLGIFDARSSSTFDTYTGLTDIRTDRALTIGRGQIYVGGAAGTVTTYHFAPNPGTDTKVFRRLSTDAAMTLTWRNLAFDDAAWTNPAPVTPDPAHPLIGNGVAEPVWQRSDEAVTNVQVFFRQKINMPAETFVTTEPGIILVPWGQLGDLGPELLWSYAFRGSLLFNPLNSGDIAVAHSASPSAVQAQPISDSSGTARDYFVRALKPGAANIVAYVIPSTASTVGTSATDPTTWIARDMLVAYCSAVDTSGDVGGETLVVGRSTVQFIG